MKIRALFVLFVAAITPGWSQEFRYNQSPSRAFGQAQLNIVTGAPNLVEGREIFNPQSLAIDTSVSPPILYVADTGNNRVLAWKNANAFTKGDKADLAIGQPDLLTTLASGPRQGTSTGLTSPTAVAVDARGNLYVADAGNNRILRYPKPFNQTGDFPTPDMVLGQRSFTSGTSANEGSSIPSAQTISLSQSSLYQSSLVFDKQGNLWFSDAGNNRVLRYPAAALAAGQSEPSADLVVGQQTFDVNLDNTKRDRSSKAGIPHPAGLAISDSGDLYVADDLGRVVYYKAPVSSFSQPARILGVVVATAIDPNPRTVLGCPSTPPYPCDGVLGAALANNAIIPPTGIALLGNNLFVADTGNHRIVKFDSPDKWPGECIPTADNKFTCAQGTIFSPPGIQFIGQLGGQSVKPNQGKREAAANTLASPTALAFVGTDLYVADAGNNRILVFPQNGGLYTSASRLLGQLDWPYSAPNLIEGRELFIYGGFQNGQVSGGSGIAVDTTSDPPHLYISDSLNNRVLGFRDARKVTAGATADLVIGQQDFFHSAPNYATNDPNSPTDATVYLPEGLVVDANGNLYVADSANGRVLRFARPFDQPASGPIRANLVLGQQDFFSQILDPTSRNMARPYGLALTQTGHLLVSDPALNRVLLFRKPSGGDFTNFQAAAAVFGQSSFTSKLTGSDRNRLAGPRGIATDSSDRLYVCDTLNNRVSIFTGVLNGEIDPSARFTPSVSSPHGIAVNSRGEVWVTDVGSNRLLRFPIYEDWFNNPTPLGQIPAVVPFAVGLDGNDNPIVAEGLNRVSIYYLQAAFRNAASYVIRGLAPGSLSYLYRYGPAFNPSGTNVSASTLPWPTVLADTSVMFNGSAAPVFHVGPDRVDFQVPGGAPTSGTADVQVVRASTGEVLAAATFNLQPADPALFTTNQQGFGQLAALNEDGTVNSFANPAKRGKTVTLFGTGLGPVPGQPADGQGASGAVSAPQRPRVAMTPGPAGFVPDANITYFGLAPGLPGLFQMNVIIPDTVPPSNTVNIAFFYLDYPSNDGPNGKVVTTIAVQ